eukprot:1630335-Rhodomonas_salina.1
MEGIELEARHETESEDVGLMAELDHNAKVLKLKDRLCVRCDEEHGYFDPSMIQLIIVCFLLFLRVLYCRSH